MKDKIEIDIINILHSQGHYEPGINLESKFDGDLGLDSMDRAELIMEVEKHFSVEISDSSAERVTTLGDLVDLVNNKIEERGETAVW